MVLPYPTFEDGQPCAVQQGAGFALTKTEKSMEFASCEFLTWLTSPMNNTEFVLNSGYLPANKEAFNYTLPKLIGNNTGSTQEVNIGKVIHVALDSYNTIDLYTYKPFKHSEDLRFYFEDMMLSRAKAARDAYLKDIANGLSIDDANKKYTSDEAFNDFLTGVQDEVAIYDY
jgi:multiple sugar transport system substrate-binding protein